VDIKEAVPEGAMGSTITKNDFYLRFIIMPVAGVAVFIAYILGLTGLTLGLLYGLRAVKLI
jgi:hypothetical protein